MEIFSDHEYTCRGKITWDLVKMSPGKPGNNLEFHLTKVLRTMQMSDLARTIGFRDILANSIILEKYAQKIYLG